MRVRFAPSPTGYLHVGGARTALFNWLLARHAGGTFVLRIEDTDVERSSADMVTGILDSMRWLGLDWDEGPDVGGAYGPYFQSERLDRYRELAERLVQDRHAYYCYCDPEDLKARRHAAEAEGASWQYDGRCRQLSSAHAADFDARRLPRAVRVRVPPGSTTFTDLVRGEITVDHAHIEDFVILRNDGHPTYHLSVVADDVDMRISQVVRGDDHISNTPKQVLLYRALGAPTPQFAHVPLILGPDKKRLSKRHGATSVGEYERQGFLPEAMVNFLALLGWSPGSGDEEVFSRQELVDRFSLDGISGGSAVFSTEKLEWFNQQHIARMPMLELRGRVLPLLSAAGVEAPLLDEGHRPWLDAVLELLRPRARRLQDFVEKGQVFFQADVEYDEAAVVKHLPVEMRPHVAALKDAFADLPLFRCEDLEFALRALAVQRDVKPAALIHAARVAVTGTTVSPGLFDTFVLLGRDRVLSRLAHMSAA